MYLPIKIIKVVPKMSFPPGPPLHLPGIPPLTSMMPPPYSMPPMGGMIPMTVGMMPGPMMAPVAMSMPAPLSMPPPSKMTMKKSNTNHTSYKRDGFQSTWSMRKSNYEPQEIVRGPPVTVFVGNITERAPDNLIRQILQRCGIVMNWKRVQGANGKLQAFGFCEYGEPEAALRAIRLLHDWEIGSKKLVVKVDAKTKEKLDEYKAKILAKQDDDEKKPDKETSKEEDGNENEEKEEGETSDDTLDQATRQRDEIIRTAIESIIRGHEAELSKPVEAEESPPSPAAIPPIPEKSASKSSTSDNSPKPRSDYERFRKNDLDEMDLEDDKKSLIHREIDKFRDTYKELILVEG